MKTSMKIKFCTEKNNIFLISKFVNSSGYLVFNLITYILLKTLKVENNLIGLCLTIITFVKIPGIIVGGKLSDIYNIKHMYVGFQVFSGILLCLCPLFFDYQYLVIILLCVIKFFLGMVSPSNTKIMNVLAGKNRKRELFSQIYWITNIGGGVAAILGGVLFSYSSFLIFEIDGLTNILSGLLGIFMGNIAVGEMNESIENKMDYFHIFTFFKNDKKICKYIFITLVFMFVYSQYSYLIPLTLDDDFGARATKIYSIILFVNSITIIVGTNILTKILKRKSTIKCLMISFGMLALGFIWYIFKTSIVIVIISAVLWTIAEIIYGINELVYIAENVDNSNLGRVMGIYDSLHNFIIAIAPLICSAFVINFGLKLSWIGIVLLSLFMVFFTSNFEK